MILPDHRPGTTFGPYTINIVDESEDPIDLSPYTSVELVIYKQFKKRIIATLDSGLSDSGGGVLEIESQIIDVPLGTYKYYIRFSNDDDTFDFVFGTWKFTLDAASASQDSNTVTLLLPQSDLTTMDYSNIPVVTSDAAGQAYWNDEPGKPYRLTANKRIIFLTV